GVCAGTAVTVCSSGDGCCPSGCNVAQDSDCGGVVYMASAGATTGFYAYDLGANSWAVLPNPPGVTLTQITTDGANVLLLGTNNSIYSFDPAVGTWSVLQQGPGLLPSGKATGFLKWTPSAIYYAQDGNSFLRYSSGGGSWVSIALPAIASCAGSFD